MGGYVWDSNSLFLIQVHGKISVNSHFVWIQAADSTQPKLELDPVFLLPTFLFSPGFSILCLLDQIISSSLNTILSEFPFLCGFLLLHLQMPVADLYPGIYIRSLECKQCLLSFFTTNSYSQWPQLSLFDVQKISLSWPYRLKQYNLPANKVNYRESFYFPCRAADSKILKT